MDGELAGYALLSLRKDSRAVRIYSIAVDARFARRGVGLGVAAGLREIRPPARQPTLTLEVRYDNAPAIALYEKWGFGSSASTRIIMPTAPMALRYRKMLGSPSASGPGSAAAASRAEATLSAP